jgi:hypothetical protein
MAKDVTKRARKEGVVAHPSATPRVRLGEVLVQARTALRELMLGSGFQVLTAMLEEDREALCGPRHSQSEERRAYRHGSEDAPVVLGGRKVRVKKLRVRSATGGEIPLPTWQEVTQEDPLQERAFEQMLVGASIRRYARSLEPLPAGVESLSVSRSSVSRRFVARTTEQVKAFLSRPLDGLDLPVLMIDGTALGDHVLLVALGIDSQGHKHVLGVREGSTESHGVCQSLLRLAMRSASLKSPKASQASRSRAMTSIKVSKAFCPSDSLTLSAAAGPSIIASIRTRGTPFRSSRFAARSRYCCCRAPVCARKYQPPSAGGGAGALFPTPPIQ